MKVNFFTEDVNFKMPKPTRIRKWIGEVVEREGYKLQDINYIFCSDSYLHSINLQYLNHDTLTDIITFDRADKEKTIAGDVFISIDRVQENAADLAVDFWLELHRVLVHGILHLCGHSDKTDAQRASMREKEDACLSLLSH